ncbi:type III ribulose-bisphosphate carboxylase [Nanoarchaeota archaeon]|nr:MAG: type III ribulose-bisphosphate carboxylase [Nanoarchaeota archaeon]
MGRFVDLDYEPKENDLIVKFYLEARDLEKAVDAVCEESSIGTWTKVTTMNERIWEMRARAFKIEKLSENSAIIEVAYPSILFERGNMAQILSSIAGNIFGMKILDNLRLLEVNLPRDLLKSFKGPKFGIQGVREILKIYDRPLLGSIVKPKIGLSSDEHARAAYEAWVGGVDIVKDDENLTNQDFNKFEERVVKTLRMLEKAEEETGERKAYLPNVTAETKEMLRRARFVKDQNGTYVMVDIITCGASAVQTLREENEDLGLVIHAHRAGHAALDRNEKHGISMKAIAQIFRAIGVDQLHVGTVVGKMVSPKEEVLGTVEALIKSGVHKPVFPVASGGLHPGLVPDLVKIFGKDVIIQAGGGIWGHPMGGKAGAREMRKAIEATLSGKSLEEAAKESKELEVALEKWKS